MMRIVVLGRSLSTDHADTHAAVYRPLLSALARLGHEILVLTPANGPWGPPTEPDGCEVETYADLSALKARRSDLAMADVLIMASGRPEPMISTSAIARSERRAFRADRSA